MSTSVRAASIIPRADVSSRDGGPATGSADVVAAIERTVAATARAAALACRPWVGSGDKNAADAATSAMCEGLGRAPGTGIVVIGEGEKGEAPMLYNGERVGDGAGPEFEIAVDPLECTDNCADGLPGALATIAVAGSGTLRPGGGS